MSFIPYLGNAPHSSTRRALDEFRDIWLMPVCRYEYHAQSRFAMNTTFACPVSRVEKAAKITTQGSIAFASSNKIPSQSTLKTGAQMKSCCSLREPRNMALAHGLTFRSILGAIGAKTKCETITLTPT